MMNILVGLFVAILGTGETKGSSPTPSSNPTSVATNVRITGGEKANFGDFPHQLFMEVLNETAGENVFKCGAIIYNSAWALTAAHCVYKYENRPDLFTLNAGHLNRNEHNTTGFEQAVKVSKVITHPKYAGYPPLLNDIALMKIKGKFKFSQYVHPIKLSAEAEIIGEKAVVSGWGDTHPIVDSNPDVLMKAQLDIRMESNCGIYGIDFNMKIQICAGRFGKSTCRGDSGGPVEVDKKLVCIVSFGPEVCDASPGVYTRVSAFKEWIEDVTYRV